MSDYKPGTRWKSGACGAEFVVVRPPSEAGEITCAGVPLRPHTEALEVGGEVPEGSEGTSAGKRYADAESGIELLCTKPGAGDLSFKGRALKRKDAKPLPSSD